MDDLIKRLDEFRLENRISQEKLAEMLDVAFVTVNRWLNGHSCPSKIQEHQPDNWHTVLRSRCLVSETLTRSPLRGPE